MPSQAEVVKVNNLDIVMLAEKYDRMAMEVEKSQSALLNEFQSFDKNRIAHFIQDISGFIDYSSKLPSVDYAHSHPNPRPIGPPKAKDDFALENEAANLLRAEILRARYNLVHCQSSVRASGYMEHDLKRILDQLQRIADLLNKYIDQILPVDRPETFDRDIDEAK